MGALAVMAAIQQALNGSWTGGNNLIAIVIDFLHDTRVRDRLIELQVLNGQPIQQVGMRFGSSGFVAESVPLAIYVAQQITHLTVEQIFNALIEVGGDTDTICSMTGQLIGSL